MGLPEGFTYEGCYEVWQEGKLSPRYIGPYQISKRVCKVVHELELPSKLATLYMVFHIVMLMNCMSGHSHIVPIENIGSNYSISYEEILVQILDH